MIFWKEAFRRRHNGDGAAERLGEGNCLFLSASRPQFAADQQHGLLAAGKDLGCRRDRRFERLGVAWLFGDNGADRPWRRAGRGGDIAGNLNIGRLFLSQRGADRIVDLVRRISRGGNCDGGASEFFRYLELIRKIVRGESVMQ